MSPRWRPRPGHSLVELIVALAFLATTLSAIAATALLASREAGRAIRVQDAAARAAEVLDSLVTTGPSGRGAVEDGALRLEWMVEPGGDGWYRVVVRSLDPTTRDTIVGITGGWAPPPPRAEWGSPP